MNFRWLYRRGLIGLPVGLWLILVVGVVVALAAWILVSITANVGTTSAAFGPFPFKSDEFSFVGCTGGFVGDVVNVTWPDATPNGSCRAILRNLNSGGVPAYGKWVAVIDDPAILLTDEQCGTALAPAGVGLYPFTLNLDGGLSQPATVYNTSYELRMTYTAPTCP
jgi:hypothetical protein